MVVKKKFFDVSFPILNKESSLLSTSLESLEGRFVKIDLSRQLKGKSTEAIFKIVLDDKKAVGKPVRMKLMPYFIQRMMKDSVSYIEDSFSTQCKNAQLRIKPFLITRKKVHRSVRKALRDKVKELLTEEIKNSDYETFFSSVINNKIQKPLSLKLKKLYPLSLCEIRELKLEKLFDKTGSKSTNE
ncbi:hypothetical protein HYV49_01670 [Candidatus Pacearchaeota archaeon]|nr:hypothetical protein [Candidatus Pacearchaeota archaeon]